jgi:hypothetical protein
LPKQKEKYQYTSHYNTTKPSTTIQSEIIPGASDIELTGDVYLEDDKTLRLNPDGSIPVRDNDVGGMTNLFAGITFNPVKTVYLSNISNRAEITGEDFGSLSLSVGCRLF